MLVLTTKQMKRAESITNQLGISFAQLMENAGASACRYICGNYDVSNKSCVVLCGSGNNAGDGFVFAREYYKYSTNICIVMCGSMPQTEESMQVFQSLREFDIDIIRLENNPEEVKNRIDDATFVVDAIFGTGFHGDLDNFIGSLVDYVNRSKLTRISLDIPSGISADDGDFGEIYFHPHVTLCFAALKPLHDINSSKVRCGKIVVLDIGITDDVIYAVYNNTMILYSQTIEELLPKRDPYSHKGDYGKLLNICGSVGMSGAAMMATLASMRTGAGVTTLASAKSVTCYCAPNLMEAMTVPLSEDINGSISYMATDKINDELQDKTACLIGCGLSVTLDTKRIVEYVIKNANCNLVIDADALNCISENPNSLFNLKKTAIITPHIGEMARLAALSIEEVKRDMCKTAKDFASRYNVIVVLKGRQSVIATPDGKLYQNCTGNPCLAKGGSGDVLAGIIAGFLAQGINPIDSAICGVYLHGFTADLLVRRMSEYSILARDLIEELPYALKKLNK